MMRMLLSMSLVALLGMFPAIANAGPRGDDARVLWRPAVAPEGPVVVVVSIPAQRADVYRNGVRIGSAPVSTGRPGYETPAGVYPILEKQREHYSNLYDDAPMPFMQRLTWSGVALHAGNLPGYPASHGCIRLPEEFAEALYSVTARGTVVVVTNIDPGASMLVPIPLLAAAGASAGGAGGQREVPANAPLSLVLSTRERMLVALRGGIEIARTAVQLERVPQAAGTTAYVRLAGTLPSASTIVPDRPALPWMAVPLDGAAPPREAVALEGLVNRSRARIPGEFARFIYDQLEPGSVLVITDEPVSAMATDPDILQSASPTGEATEP